MIRRLFIMMAFLGSLSACRDHQIVAIKDFKIFVASEDVDLRHSVRVLTDRYNRQMGFETLRLVNDPEEGNSSISFPKGLHNTGHRLGQAHWLTTTIDESQLSLSGEQSQSTVIYAMEVEFDYENFKSKAAFVNDASSDEAKHLYHLFCHEVGHGLQLGHDEDINSVMYTSIPDRTTRFVDFQSYFSMARAFMFRED